MTVEQLETFSNTKPELRYLTEEIIKYLGANPPGSPGGDSLVLSATVELTDAQIKALPTTGIEIVAAQGSGKIIVPVSCTIVTNIVTDGYDNQSADIKVGIPIAGSNTLNSGSWVVFDADGYGVFGSQGEKYYFNLQIGQNLDDGQTQPSDFGSNADNVALKIKVTNALGNLTGGNAANTLKVTVYYTVVDL